MTLASLNAHFTLKIIACLTLLTVGTVLGQAEIPQSYRTVVLQGPHDDMDSIAELTGRINGAVVVNYHQLISSQVDLADCHCLIIPNSVNYPAQAASILEKFINSGKDLILLGGHAFTNPLWQFKGQWLTRTQLHKSALATAADIKPIFKADTAAKTWKRNAQNLQTASTINHQDGIINISIKDLALWAWDSFEHRLPRKKLKNHNALNFQLKASPQTRTVVVEIAENDKSRWVYVVPVTDQWQKYTVPIRDFTFFADGSPPNRGFDGDSLNLQNAKTIAFGMAFNISPFNAGDHDITIKELATARIDIPDGLYSETSTIELPIFETREIYQLEDITSISPYGSQNIIRNIHQTDGKFKGTSAVGFAYPDASDFIPLLIARDQYNRDRGIAAGLLIHYQGPYAPGQWLISGINNPEFYQTATFKTALDQTLRRMKNRELPQISQSQNEINKSRTLKPHPGSNHHLTISPDGKHFVTADNQRFFAIGCNYLGPSDRKCHLASLFDPVKIENDFRLAKKAGINLFRFWLSNLDENPDNFRTILALAEKYNIYLLLLPQPHAQPTDHETIALLERCVKLAADSPMVVGYDLMNEPLITEVGSVRIAGQPAPIIEHKPYNRYPADLTKKLWVDQLTKNRSGWPAVKPWVNDTDARQLYAAHYLGENLILKLTTCDNISLLCGLENNLQLPPEYQEFQTAVDQTFANWLDFQIKTIKSIAPEEYITVGYNTPLAALYANQALDFQAYHLYNLPYSRNDFETGLATLERLRKIFPAQPVTLGEFGYSEGLKMPDGTYLDMYSASVAEMITLLYSYAHQYSGVMFWLLTEWPVANIKYNAPWVAPEKLTTESRFGLYCYDGTESSRPKPIAHATAFLAKYLAENPTAHSARFELTDADTPIKTGYVFTAPKALFIGNRQYKSPALSFHAAQPANLMLTWNDKELTIMSTADVALTISPESITARKAKEVTIGLLAGETVRIPLDPQEIN